MKNNNKKKYELWISSETNGIYCEGSYRSLAVAKSKGYQIKCKNKKRGNSFAVICEGKVVSLIGDNSEDNNEEYRQSVKTDSDLYYSFRDRIGINFERQLFLIDYDCKIVLCLSGDNLSPDFVEEWYSFDKIKSAGEYADDDAEEFFEYLQRNANIFHSSPGDSYYSENCRKFYYLPDFEISENNYSEQELAMDFLLSIAD